MKKIVFALLIFLSGFGQEQPRCPEKTLLKSKKNYQQRIDALKNLDNLPKSPNARISVGLVYRIPVVVHVIHNNRSLSIGGETNQNISKEQILSQLKVLNDDYRNKMSPQNFNSNGSDVELEFFLATKDPEGKPTSGIIRVFNDQADYDLNSELEFVSSLSYWDSKKYLNVWVLALTDGYLGYGELPFLPSLGLEDQQNEKIDGIFVDYRNFGKGIGTSTIRNDRPIYSYGRTLTHEIGHWLGLFHTWGDAFCGDDLVEDTPTTNSANQTKFCRDKFSNCGGIRTRNLIENYMDYSPDSCMNSFTNGQKIRMRTVIEKFPNRRLVTLNGESMSLPQSAVLAVDVFPNPVSDKLFYRTLLPKQSKIFIEIFNETGNSLYQEAKNTTESYVDEIDVQNFKPGIYLIKINNEEASKTIRFFKN